MGLMGEYSVLCYTGYLDSKVLKVILGSFGAFQIFSNPVSRKQRLTAKRTR